MLLALLGKSCIARFIFFQADHLSGPFSQMRLKSYLSGWQEKLSVAGDQTALFQALLTSTNKFAAHL